MPAASSLTQPDFIEVYDNALDPGACRALIERFEASGLAQRGETGGGVDISVKDSWDIPLQEYPSWSDAQQMLNDAVLVGFKRYLRRYPHVALATSRLLKTQLHDVGTTDPVSIAVAVVVLAASAVVAVMVPALKASRVSPIVALRAE